MATTWNTSRTTQNFQTRCRQWRSLCVNRRSKSASSGFLRIAALMLLSFPVIAKSSQEDLPSKVQDEGQLVQGSDGEVFTDENSDEGVVNNQLDPMQLLRALAESDDKDIGGRTETKAKRKWSNNEYLRVWGKRDALRKLFAQDAARDSSSRGEILPDGSRPGREAFLVLLDQKRSDVRGNPSLAQLQEIARQSGAGLRVFEEPYFNPQFWRPAAAVPRRAGATPKRKWERNSLRIWGKRNEADPLSDSLLNNERSMYTNMRRRKWENLPLRVWGR